MSGETDLTAMLRTMRPDLRDQPYVFCSITTGDYAGMDTEPLGVFREHEGVTLILTTADALRLGLHVGEEWACITLLVHSALAAVGLTAAVSSALATAGISANMIAAYYHDHVFVPWERREQALATLVELSRRAGTAAKIEQIDADAAEALLPELVELLRDAVASGASVGFLPPLSDLQANDYWHGVVAAVRGPLRILLIARDGGRLVGAVQLDLAGRANGSHRAEVAKLLVHTASRRQGIGRALMQALEGIAGSIGRTTLVLDTRAGDPSERLYLNLGYIRAGLIPEYARSADGYLHTTAFFYKLLH
jgi:GNAT superfamily N-acetyltransferase